MGTLKSTVVSSGWCAQCGVTCPAHCPLRKTDKKALCLDRPAECVVRVVPGWWEGTGGAHHLGLMGPLADEGAARCPAPDMSIHSSPVGGTWLRNWGVICCLLGFHQSGGTGSKPDAWMEDWASQLGTLREDCASQLGAWTGTVHLKQPPSCPWGSLLGALGLSVPGQGDVLGAGCIVQLLECRRLSSEATCLTMCWSHIRATC